MAEYKAKREQFEGRFGGQASNVKQSRNYERFGETIRYMTWQEYQLFLDSIDRYEHKLMMRVIYELGCRVGEFVRIRLADVDFRRGRVFFPKENTKTKRRRTSYLPHGLINELKSWLKRQGRMTAREERLRYLDEFLFSPHPHWREHYTENRIRQIFRMYAEKAGLNRQYGQDRVGRGLHELTVHSLRHTHIMTYIHVHKLPIAVVQKQVGHTSLKTTSVYLNPSDEAVADAYREAQKKPMIERHNI